jgi:hypothetical protein
MPPRWGNLVKPFLIQPVQLERHFELRAPSASLRVRPVGSSPTGKPDWEPLLQSKRQCRPLTRLFARAMRKTAIAGDMS